jgi:hypothetical protein
MATFPYAHPAILDGESSLRLAVPRMAAAARSAPRHLRHLAPRRDDILLRVRVVDEAHPMVGAVGTVTLRAFESAARSGAAGQFEATFESGPALVRFAQVELEPDDLGAFAAGPTRP